MDHHRTSFFVLFAPLAGNLFTFLIEVIENHQTCAYKLKICRRQVIFATLGIGIEGGGILITQCHGRRVLFQMQYFAGVFS